MWQSFSKWLWWEPMHTLIVLIHKKSDSFLIHFSFRFLFNFSINEWKFEEEEDIKTNKLTNGLNKKKKMKFSVDLHALLPWKPTWFEYIYMLQSVHMLWFAILYVPCCGCASVFSNLNYFMWVINRPQISIGRCKRNRLVFHHVHFLLCSIVS